MMSIKEEFLAAAQDIQKLPSRPDNSTLLSLYSLYKQATEGDVKGVRPGVFDLVGRKKYDAWAERKGTEKEDSMREYITLVKRLRSS